MRLVASSQACMPSHRLMVTIPSAFSLRPEFKWATGTKEWFLAITSPESHILCPRLTVQTTCPGSCALTIFVNFYVLMLVLSVLTFFNDTRLPCWQKWASIYLHWLPLISPKLLLPFNKASCNSGVGPLMAHFNAQSQGERHWSRFGVLVLFDAGHVLHGSSLPWIFPFCSVASRALAMSFAFFFISHSHHKIHQKLELQGTTPGNETVRYGNSLLNHIQTMRCNG